MKRVIIESPYAGDIERNVTYAHRCIADSLKRGEAPFASHILYTTALRDHYEVEREQGIKAGFEWGLDADICAVYVDYGVSEGMERGILNALDCNLGIEYRTIGEN